MDETRKEKQPMTKYLIENHCYTDQVKFANWLKKRIGKKVYIDGDDLVDSASDKTICTFVKRNVSYEDALAEAKKYYGIV